MNLEEIKKARAIEYNFTIENWDTITPLRYPMWDIDLLVAEVERQAEEIGRLEVDRDLAKYDKEKARAELAEWKKNTNEQLAVTAQLELDIDMRKAENQRLTERLEKYNELLMAVGNKYPGKTRHETALRYIRRREEEIGSAQALQTKEGE